MTVPTPHHTSQHLQPTGAADREGSELRTVLVLHTWSPTVPVTELELHWRRVGAVWLKVQVMEAVSGRVTTNTTTTVRGGGVIQSNMWCGRYEMWRRGGIVYSA